MNGPWDTRELVRTLIERLRIDNWLKPDGAFVRTDEASVSKALDEALRFALYGRTMRESPVPADLAKGFLVETMTNKDLPLAERMQAAALLLEVKP